MSDTLDEDVRRQLEEIERVIQDGPETQKLQPLHEVTEGEREFLADFEISTKRLRALYLPKT